MWLHRLSQRRFPAWGRLVILVNQSCLNALCFCWYSVTVLAESASGFNWPAAVWACDVMLLKSASLCVCQFKPAVPKHRLTLCICLDQFLLVEDLCNAEQSRPHLATFTQADVTFVLVPLLFTSCYFFSSLFTLSQLCRCCSTNPPRPTLHLRAMSEQCSTSKDWVRINSWLKPVKFVDGILENSQRKHSCWLIMDVGYNWSAVICVSEINYMGAFKKNSIFSYFLCFAMKLYIYIPFAYWVVNS